MDGVNESQSEITRELAQWAGEQDQVSRRYEEEKWELDEQRYELLLRAREAGMTNSQIAEALSSEGDLRYYAQTVTALMGDADERVRQDTSRFIRDALRETEY